MKSRILWIFYISIFKMQSPDLKVTHDLSQPDFSILIGLDLFVHFRSSDFLQGCVFAGIFSGWIF